METNILRNKREQLRRGKKTLFKKAHKLAKVHKIDIALIMQENGRYYTYIRSTDRICLPPRQHLTRVVRITPTLLAFAKKGVEYVPFIGVVGPITFIWGKGVWSRARIHAGSSYHLVRGL
jgi:hypothetical protein